MLKEDPAALETVGVLSSHSRPGAALFSSYTRLLALSTSSQADKAAQHLSAGSIHKFSKAQKFLPLTPTAEPWGTSWRVDRDRQAGGFSLDPGRDQSRTKEGNQGELEKDIRTAIF